MKTSKIKLAKSGRIIIPYKIRKQLNLNAGDELSIELTEDGNIIITSPRASLKKLQTLVGKCRENLVDKFIEDRKLGKI